MIIPKRALFFAMASLILMAAQIAAADVRLQFDQSNLLPGTPTGITVVVSNPSRKPLNLPPFLWLRGTDANLDSFRIAAFTASGAAGVGLPESDRKIGAGETREFRFDPTVVLAGSPWFSDGRLSAPGRYRVRAVISPAMDATGNYAAADSLASEELEVVVETQTESDSAVWSWMAQRGDGRWGESEWLRFAPELAHYVATEHPDSRYHVYTALFLPGTEEERIERLRRTIEEAEGEPFADQLRLLLAQYYRDQSDLKRRSDAAAAANSADAARRIASDLATGARSVHVREAAKKLLGCTPTGEQLRRSR